jgi:hypothetical protein
MKRIPSDKKDPITLAQELSSNADSAQALVKVLKKYTSEFNSAYNQELDDIETWSLLSRYFAAKLRAGVSLQLFRTNGRQINKTDAIAHLQNGLEIWKELSEITDQNYYEVPYFKNNVKEDNPDLDNFSWKKYIPEVERDIEIARQ